MDPLSAALQSLVGDVGLGDPDDPSLTWQRCYEYRNGKLKVGKDLPSQVSHCQDNHFAPPEGDACLINNLPHELLSRIFELIYDHDIYGFDVETALWMYNDFVRWPPIEREVEGQDEDNENEGEGVTEVEDVEESGCEREAEENEGKSEGEEEGEEGDEDEDAESDEGHANGSHTRHFGRCPSFPFSIVLSHVCRHWRDVALSTLSLWSTIIVRSGPYDLESTFLHRSQDHPVDVYIDFAPQYLHHDLGAPSDDNVKLLPPILVPHIHHLRTIQATLSGRHMHILLNALSGPSVSAASQLTTLRLHQYGKTEVPDTSEYPNISDHFTLFGGSAPMLTTVVLWGVYVDWDQPWIAAASNLRELELAFHPEVVRPSWRQLATILRGAPGLERLSLRKSGPSGHPVMWFIELPHGGRGDPDVPIELSRVTSFTLAERSPARASELLLRKLCLPSLKRLSLELDNKDENYDDFVLQLVRPAQQQSHSLLSRLETFKLIALRCNTEFIGTLYGELQNVTTLYLSIFNLSRDFLNILSTPCTIRGDIWLPKLGTLCTVGGPWEEHCEIIRMRRDAEVPIKSLFVKPYTSFPRDRLVWVIENMETFQFFRYGPW